MGRSASKAGNGRTALLRALAAGLLALVLAAQGAVAAGRSRHGGALAAAASVVAPAAQLCADAHDAGGSSRSPCGDLGACCILCAAAASTGAEHVRAATVSPPARPTISTEVGRRLFPASGRPAGWVTSWSAQAPPALS
jgi:hypothetical protein